nr:MAG TPA: hypothetical protein [Caudoviricetes sp.]
MKFQLVNRPGYGNCCISLRFNSSRFLYFNNYPILVVKLPEKYQYYRRFILCTDRPHQHLSRQT